MLSSMAETKRSEGQALAALITEKYGSRGQATFAQKAKVSAPTVTIWVSTDRFKRGMWRSVKEAVEANGLEWKSIREEPITFSRDKATSSEHVHEDHDTDHDHAEQ